MNDAPREHEHPPKGRITAARVPGLLGPQGPEISCERCFEELDTYVERDLAGGDAEALVPGMRAHLEGCPACAEDFESLRALLLSEQGH